MVLFRRPHNDHPICHAMSRATPQIFNELHTNDGSSIRSSDDGASGSPIGDDRERARLIAKMNAVKEKLKLINLQREGDVEEFLSLSREAEQQRGIDPHNPQMARIRQHFEKKNKRHTVDSEHLQKKLNGYESRLTEIESGTNFDSNKGNVMSSVGHGIRRTGGNIKQMTETVISAPMELANRLKNKTFGSADNVNDVSEEKDDSKYGHSVFYASSEHGTQTRDTQSHSKSSTLPADLRMNAGTHDLNQIYRSALDEDRRSAQSSALSVQQIEVSSREELLMEELKKMTEKVTQLEEIISDIRKNQNELKDQVKSLEGEGMWYKKIEDDLNESIMVHQAEFLSLKQEQKTIVNRVDYQYNDRFRNVEENLEAVQNQMIRMENSFKHSLDLRGNPSIGNAAVLSVANILVEFLKIFLYVVATILDFFRIFTGSRNRAGILVVALVLLIILLNYIDLPIPWRRRSSSDL